MKGSSMRSHLGIAIATGVHLGCVLALCFPNGFFSISSLVLNRRFAKSIAQAKHAEISELKKKVREMTENYLLVEQWKDVAEKRGLVLGDHKKAGPFGTVKGMRTNPSVVPDDSVNPRLAYILYKVAVNKEIIVSLANSNVKELLQVWFTSIKRVGITNYLVALDDETARYCEANDVPVYKRDPEIGLHPVARNGANHAASGLKFRILRKFLQVGYSVLLSDVDIVYLQNPFDYLNRDSDVEAMTDGHNNITADGYNDVFDEPKMGWARYAHTMRMWVYNSGFFYIRPTIPSIEPLVGSGGSIFFGTGPVKTVRKDENLRKLMPVVVHVNYHPDKLARMLTIVEFYVDGKKDAMKNFPDGSEYFF